MEMKIWPVVTGCFRISEGCFSCPSFWEYTQRGEDYTPTEHYDALKVPTQNKEDTAYDVAFGSDLFDRNVSSYFIKKVFKVMNENPQHTFQLGTKRIDRVEEMQEQLHFTKNIYLGVAVEARAYLWRIKVLQRIPAKFKFVSMVPVLENMGPVDLTGIDLASAAKETWGYQRPALQEWIYDIRMQCQEQGVEFSDVVLTYKEGEMT